MDDETRPPTLPDPEADDTTIQDDPSSTVLDLTSFQLHDLDSVELPPSLTELDLTANRLSTLDPRIGQLSNLKKLSLRQNLIDDNAVEPISRWDALSGLEVFNLFPRRCFRFNAFIGRLVVFLLFVWRYVWFP